MGPVAESVVVPAVAALLVAMAAGSVVVSAVGLAGVLDMPLVVPLAVVGCRLPVRATLISTPFVLGRSRDKFVCCQLSVDIGSESWMLRLDANRRRMELGEITRICDNPRETGRCLTNCVSAPCESIR